MKPDLTGLWIATRNYRLKTFHVEPLSDYLHATAAALGRDQWPDAVLLTVESGLEPCRDCVRDLKKRIRDGNDTKDGRNSASGDCGNQSEKVNYDGVSDEQTAVGPGGPEPGKEGAPVLRHHEENKG